MDNRAGLDYILEKILTDSGISANVYFNPPESIKLLYPCIIYKLSDMNTVPANNMPYMQKNFYNVTLIHNDPDNVIKDKILNLPCCRFVNTFISDNLYHYVYKIYY